MSLIRTIGAKRLGFFAAILGLALSDDLGADELNTLGNFIVGIGCVILIVAAQKQFLISQQERTTPDAEAMEKLKTRIQHLEQTWAACLANKV